MTVWKVLFSEDGARMRVEQLGELKAGERKVDVLARVRRAHDEMRRAVSSLNRELRRAGLVVKTTAVIKWAGPKTPLHVFFNVIAPWEMELTKEQNARLAGLWQSVEKAAVQKPIKNFGDGKREYRIRIGHEGGGAFMVSRGRGTPGEPQIHVLSFFLPIEHPQVARRMQETPFKLDGHENVAEFLKVRRK